MRLRFWTSQKEHDELAARITHLEAYQKRSAEVLSNNIGPAIIDLRKQISAQKDQYDLLEKQRGATHALLAHLQARVTRVELLVDRLRRRRGGNDGDDSNDVKKKDVQEFDESKHNDNNNNYVGKGKGRMIDVQNATAHEQLPTQHQHQYDIPSPLQLRRAARRRSRPVGDKAFNNSGRLPRRNGDIMSWTPAERDLYGPLIQDGGAGQPKR